MKKTISYMTAFHRNYKFKNMYLKRTAHKSLILGTTILSLTCLINSVFAEDIYISQNPTGSNSGADCLNAHSAAWFNTASNWYNPKQSGKIGPADTVHLCGTFTGSSNNTMLTPQASGTPGNIITILFEQNAKLTAPYWNGCDCAINATNKSYITIDGGYNGIIEATANGTSLANQQTSCGVNISGGSYDSVKNFTINNMYVHNNVANTNDTAVDQTNTNAIKFLNSSNITIDHVTIKDAGWAINGWGNNVSISNCDVSNVDHGIAFGPAGTVSNINIFNNHFHNYVNWDTASNIYHHDGIHMWGGITSGGSANDRVNGANIYNNTFDGDSGVNITAHIFLEEQIQNVRIFNNIFILPSTRSMNAVWLEGRNQTGDTYANGHGVSNALYNNYINAGKISFGGSALYTRYQDSLTVMNNIFVGGTGSISIQNSTISSNGINNNLYGIMGNGNSFGFNSKNTDDLTSWKEWLPTASGKDSLALAATFANMKIDNAGYLLSNSPAIGLGGNLTSLGISQLNYDKNGKPRPSSGSWDAGPFNFATQSTLPLPSISMISLSN